MTPRLLLWMFLPVMACGYGDAMMTETDDMSQADPFDQEVVQPGDQFEDYGTNPWIQTADEAVSTFSVDVDTASYALTRRALAEGRLPDPASVRVEEFVNYFHYDDPVPATDDPFAVHLEIAPSTFGADLELLRIGLQAEIVPEEQRDPVNLTFLIDVSGSMTSSDKLGLIVYSLGHLVDRLSPSDTLSIVTYAGAEGLVLAPTPVTEKSAILDALDALSAGGSTAGEAGIRLAYDTNESALIQGGNNRVVLCSDGDFNVGVTGDALIDVIEDFRDRGIFLTVLGFGMGNFNDADMEQLADHGNGNYAYIDTPNEALRVLGDNLVSTLQVVAKDVKVQVEFDPTVVQRYRLIGYENRLLDNDEFADDTVDAGDVGAGHHVTALYEIEWAQDAPSTEAAEVRVRHKTPSGDTSMEQASAITKADALTSMDDASRDMRWAAAVAEFAEILRGSEHSEDARFPDVLDLATGALGSTTPSRDEFLDLVEQAESLWP